LATARSPFTFSADGGDEVDEVDEVDDERPCAGIN
jgi:hypothetical protein